MFLYPRLERSSSFSNVVNVAVSARDEIDDAGLFFDGDSILSLEHHITKFLSRFKRNFDVVVLQDPFYFVTDTTNIGNSCKANECVAPIHLVVVGDLLLLLRGGGLFAVSHYEMDGVSIG